MNIRPLTFNCYRVYDMKRHFEGEDKTYVVGHHLQKKGDTHTLCGYKTYKWKKNGRWDFTSEEYFTDDPVERDRLCFRCLRVWALKNNLEYPRQWVIDRRKKEEKTVGRREDYV